MLVEIAFKPDQKLHLVLPGGAGAETNHHGRRGLTFWIRDFAPFSVEQIERNYPVVIKSVGPLSQSGGRGQFNGGEGVNWTIEIKEDAKFEWCSLQLALRSTGASQGKSGQLARLSFDQEKIDEGVWLGSRTLKAGTTIEIATAGGGGYGAPTSSTVTYA
jgi:N-methylhydantoinase B/oxoprolinase/acetone carboxylase alpha subunit